MANRGRLTAKDVLLARKRRLAAMRLQEIEGNRLSPDETAMFEMFERERWTQTSQRTYIVNRMSLLAAKCSADPHR